MWPHTLIPEDDFQATMLDELPGIYPRFFVPSLSDKPQNPIIDTLNNAAINKALPPRPLLPKELAIIVTKDDAEERQQNLRNNLWRESLTRKLGFKNQILSWDRLRSSHSSKASSTAFLSEQDSLIFAYARYNLQPRLHDHQTQTVYLSREELLASLKITVLGVSSPLHIWDPQLERITEVTRDGKGVCLLVDGRDQVISDSVINRFKNIGSMMRRLEVLLATLRDRSSAEGPTIHAFTHALSAVHVYLRVTLANSPPLNASEKSPLFAIWTHYGIYEEILVSLSTFYGRGLERLPKDYPPFDSSPVPMLSSIYQHTSDHLERQSPRIVLAIFAFILTNSSHEYFLQVGRSIGYGGHPEKNTRQTVKETYDPYAIGDEDDDDEQEDIFSAIEKVEEEFPNFFPEELLNMLPAAQKSLILLRIAKPDHLLLSIASPQDYVGWLWSTSEIESAWTNGSLRLPPLELMTALPESADLLAPITALYKPELSDFKIFDLEPGSTVGKFSLNLKDSSSSTLRAFLDAFPATLPSITPILPDLTSLIFSPLVQHASTISSALLSLFLSSSDNLNFYSHLILLRSYLLLTAPSFKGRLSAALFSDTQDYEIDTKAHSMSIRAVRSKPKRRVKEGSQPWAVGISPNLLERETWPPVGTDLSFFLRTVIVDSLEEDENYNVGETKKELVIEEAGWRLGFAIRDLPTGHGRDKWLNPLSIEALDFLYMDYKPPYPLEILISHEILSKYQRVFSFLLRLIRVEHALKSLYRMSRMTAQPLFPTLTSSKKMMLHFRFVAQSYLSNLSGYVFNTAIGGNFDPFLARLEPETSSKPATSTSFSDVFELSRQHSMILDDILSACLLRSGQRAVGDLLRHSLELILEFTVIMGELHRGRLQECQAAPLLEDVYKRFLNKMKTLTKVLKGLVDKGPASSTLPMEASSNGERKPPGGIDALYHLLIKLDLSEWWSKTK